MKVKQNANDINNILHEIRKTWLDNIYLAQYYLPWQIYVLIFAKKNIFKKISYSQEMQLQKCKM